jgi:hypothetical protein
MTQNDNPCTYPECLCDAVCREGGTRPMQIRTCRECGCTDLDCSDCVARTGQPCWWVAPELCSACGEMVDDRLVVFPVANVAGEDVCAPGRTVAVPATPAGTPVTFYRGRADQPGGSGDIYQVGGAMMFLQPVSPCYWPDCGCVAEGACLRVGPV